MKSLIVLAFAFIAGTAAAQAAPKSPLETKTIELKHLKAEQSLQDAAVKRAAALQKRLDNLPRAEGRIREVVRQNPAPCNRPVPVADSLREAIREANAARKVFADS